MTDIDLSVIIPLYNCQNFIGDCLDSLLIDSDYIVEILIINDGSTDKSLEVCRNYQDDKRIKIFNQMNQGVSVARNFGVSQAKGKYITFVDADDWVEKDFYKTIFDNISDSDILIFDGNICTKKKSYMNHVWEHSRVFSKKDKNILLAQAICYQFPQEYNPKYHGVGTAWGKVYLKSLILENNIQFPQGQRVSEDSIFNLKSMTYANKIKYIKQNVYNYRENEYSVTRSFNERYLEDSQKLINSFAFFIKKYSISDDRVSEALKYRKVMVLMGILNNYIFNKANKNGIKSELKDIREQSLIQDIMRHHTFNNINMNLFNKIVLFAFDKHMDWLIILLFGFKRNVKKVVSYIGN